MEKRRVFSREYKLAAVEKIVEQGLSYSQVARDLGIGDSMLHNWRRAFEEDGTLKALSQDGMSSEAELKRLREENRQLKMERDILKKRRPSLPKKAAKMQVYL